MAVVLEAELFIHWLISSGDDDVELDEIDEDEEDEETGFLFVVIVDIFELVFGVDDACGNRDDDVTNCWFIIGTVLYPLSCW